MTLEIGDTHPYLDEILGLDIPTIHHMKYIWKGECILLCEIFTRQGHVKILCLSLSSYIHKSFLSPTYLISMKREMDIKFSHNKVISNFNIRGPFPI